jgi:hypothetical protein
MWQVMDHKDLWLCGKGKAVARWDSLDWAARGATTQERERYSYGCKNPSIHKIFLLVSLHASDFIVLTQTLKRWRIEWRHCARHL